MANRQSHSKSVPKDEFLRLLNSEELARALRTSNEQLGSFEKKRLKILAGEQLKRATRGLVSECGWRFGRETTEELVKKALDDVEELEGKLAKAAGASAA
ncbi:MAG TPA: hypothetical protein VFK81_02170 [Terriglobales bacterium]|jgi:hypothetical protein|nr:hypothetical protein [Terriglobales bacterium]